MTTKGHALIDFNTNNFVWVQLTRVGREEIAKKEQEIRRACTQLDSTQLFPEENKEGWSQWTMWQLMETFGHLMGHGMPEPFKTNVKLQHPERLRIRYA